MISKIIASVGYSDRDETVNHISKYGNWHKRNKRESLIG